MPSYSIYSGKESPREGSSSQDLITTLHRVPVTVQRQPFLQLNDEQRLSHAGTSRVNITATYSQPGGTTIDNWSDRHKHQTVLQQHCDFFDRDQDGIIWPFDTYVGFRRLGFNVFLSMVALFIIHVNFSYPTLKGYIPDPYFRIYVANIHKAKHGSDSNTYDTEGRFNPQKFEDTFTKYSADGESLTIRDIRKLLKGQRLISDPIGWGGAFFEWLATYIMIWPEDGRLRKEDIRRVYDGSLFETLAENHTTAFRK